MAVYRFRVTFEDNDEVYREIDIKSSQSFYDFHSTILSSIGFEDNCEASFFISDDFWRKGEEIALQLPAEDTHKKSVRKTAPPKYVMSKCKMAALIDDPHQKFIYIQDPSTPWVFMVELIKILPDDIKINYPKCSKSIGTAPKKGKVPIVVPEVLDDLDDEMEEGDHHNDREAYVHADEEFDAEDLNLEVETEEEAEEEEVEDGERGETESEFGEFGDGVESFDDV
jgi:hypothetical protein